MADSHATAVFRCESGILGLLEDCSPRVGGNDSRLGERHRAGRVVGVDDVRGRREFFGVQQIRGSGFGVEVADALDQAGRPAHIGGSAGEPRRDCVEVCAFEPSVQVSTIAARVSEYNFDVGQRCQCVELRAAGYVRRRARVVHERHCAHVTFGSKRPQHRQHRGDTGTAADHQQTRWPGFGEYEAPCAVTDLDDVAHSCVFRKMTRYQPTGPYTDGEHHVARSRHDCRRERAHVPYPVDHDSELDVLARLEPAGPCGTQNQRRRSVHTCIDTGDPGAIGDRREQRVSEFEVAVRVMWRRERTKRSEEQFSDSDPTWDTARRGAHSHDFQPSGAEAFIQCTFVH